MLFQLCFAWNWLAGRTSLSASRIYQREIAGYTCKNLSPFCLAQVRSHRHLLQVTSIGDLRRNTGDLAGALHAYEVAEKVGGVVRKAHGMAGESGPDTRTVSDAGHSEWTSCPEDPEGLQPLLEVKTYLFGSKSCRTSDQRSKGFRRSNARSLRGSNDIFRCLRIKINQNQATQGVGSTPSTC